MSNNKNNNKSARAVNIAVSGTSGCGHTTVCRLMADALELRFINFTFRSLAQEKDMTLKEVLSLAEKDDSWDREVDTRQVELAREEGGCVLGSRLAIWMLPEADLKVFLTARPETRAKRIHDREGKSLKEIEEFTAYRDRQDHERYLRIYQIDNDDYSFADLIVDTDDISPIEIAELIVAEMNKKLFSG
ncbi:MAG: AAA family ATPase [Treponema sp.]|jgi:cytidylate kinase|nr:AAA family ATPase [Treponema sp.]